MIRAVITAIFFAHCFFSTVTMAGVADVVAVKVTQLEGNQYRIDVTIKHKDTGWDHYANAWQVLDEKGNVIGERVLYHPHVDEQPFTRSLTLTIPTGVKKITVRAKDSVHEFGGVEKTVTLD